jgi:type IV pilus assembly protein PilM
VSWTPRVSPSVSDADEAPRATWEDPTDPPRPPVEPSRSEWKPAPAPDPQPIAPREREPVVVNEPPAEEIEPLAATAASEEVPVPSKPVKPKRRAQRAPRGHDRPVVGLEIQPGLIVAVKSRISGRLEVEQAAYLPIEADVVRDGEVTKVDQLAESLEELFQTSKLDRRVRIGVANQRIMMRRIELPPLTDATEIEQAVQFQAQDEIPMPLPSVVLDYRSLGILEGPAGPRLNVLLVAARRDMIEPVLHAARLAGLQPEGVDLAAFGMVRALRPADSGANEQVLYLSIGGLTNLAISHGPTCEFTRVIGSGVDQIASDVASRCGVPLGEARRLLASIELGDQPRGLVPAHATPVASPDVASAFAAPAGVPQQPATPAAPGTPGHFGSAASYDPSPMGGGVPLPDHADVALAALTEGVRRIAGEVRNSLDFYAAAQGEEPVRRAVVCGPALEVGGFVSALSRELGIPVTRGEVVLASPTAAGDVPLSLLPVAAGLSVAEGAP